MKPYERDKMQPPPPGFTLGDNVPSNRLTMGMKVAYEYMNGGLGRRYFIKILGFTGASKVSFLADRMEAAVRHASVQGILKAAGVTSLKALNQKQLRYEHATHMVARDLQDGEEGAWFYLYQGKWARGSGADQCLFYRMEAVSS